MPASAEKRFQMKLLFRQRLMSWLDNYDIYYEDGSEAYTVKGEFRPFLHSLQIYDAAGVNVGTVRQEFSFMPEFSLYIGGKFAGSVRKKFSFFRNRYVMDFKNWYVSGNCRGWNYVITDGNGIPVGFVDRVLFKFADTYAIEVYDPGDALCALMFTLAIDAEKCGK